MTYLQAVVLGIVEGLTEFLPISSTGHLILAAKLLHLPQTEFVKSFEIAVQLGAILSVLALYGKKLLLDRAVFLRVSAAFVPTAVIGFALYKIIKKYLFAGETVVLISLFIGGVVLIAFERWHREKEDALSEIAQMPLLTAVWIGVFQSLAMVPGVSRAAATICGGLVLGVKRRTIVEFSFLLAVPTLAAATGLDLLKSAGAFSAGDAGILAAGFATSFVVALAAIQFLLRFIKTHTFTAFGVYRIAAAMVFWLVISGRR